MFAARKIIRMLLMQLRYNVHHAFELHGLCKSAQPTPHAQPGLSWVRVTFVNFSFELITFTLWETENPNWVPSCIFSHSAPSKLDFFFHHRSLYLIWVSFSYELEKRVLPVSIMESRCKMSLKILSLFHPWVPMTLPLWWGVLYWYFIL